MNVNTVNSVAFTAQTKKGNKYKKSNEGKKWIPIVALASNTAAFGIMKKNGMFESLNLNSIKQLKNHKGLVAGGFAVYGAFLISVGAIFDAVINRTRRKDADKFASTGRVSEKTNKGKIIMGSIGAVFAGLSALSLKSTSILKKVPAYTRKNGVVVSDFKIIETKIKSPKAYLASIVPLIIGAYTAEGAIYDHAVNKSRTKLTKIADKKVENQKMEAMVDAKVEQKLEEILSEKA